MGGAASTAGAVAAGVGKMSEGELKEIVKCLDKKTLASLHKVVVEVADSSKAEKAAATKAKVEADPEVAQKIAKAIEEAGNMRRAAFCWNEDTVPKVLEEMGLAGHCPGGLNGKQLIKDDVFQGEDAATWDTMLKVVAYRWLEDQVHDEKPFDPPQAVCEHYPWKWDVEKTNQFLEKIALPKYGLDGQTVVKNLVNDTYSELHKDKMMTGMKEELVLFFEDVAKLM